VSGKGSRPRPVDATVYAQNFDRIFPQLHKPQPTAKLTPHTQEGHGESDPAEEG